MLQMDSSRSTNPTWKCFYVKFSNRPISNKISEDFANTEDTKTSKRVKIRASQIFELPRRQLKNEDIS